MAIREIENAELAAVCDLKEDRKKEFSETYGVPGYSNYHKMLQNERIDVVCVMTPSGMHPEHSMDIMRRYRKHIVVEKPMALSLKDARKMIAVAEQEGVQLHVVMQNRFNKAVKKIEDAIRSDLFGQLMFGTVRLRWCRPQTYYDRDPWRGKWAFDGGVLTNQAIHHIDLLRYFMGEPEEVSATGATQLVDIEVENSAAAWIRFESGAVGIIEGTTVARPDDLEASISLLGENGTAIVEGTSVNRIVTWTFSDLDKEAHSEAPPTVYGFGHKPYLETVIRSLKGETPPAVDGKEGMKTLRLLHAIYRSMETRSIVRLADNPESEKLGVFTTDEDRKIRESYLSSPEEGGQL